MLKFPQSLLNNFTADDVATYYLFSTGTKFVPSYIQAYFKAANNLK